MSSQSMPTTSLSASPSPGTLARPTRWWRRSSHLVKHHFSKHVGVGLIASVAYFDPGNWSVDLQAGSTYGYKLLFVVLLAALSAVVLQAMAAKLGCVTGRDLAQHCRLVLHDRPKHTRLVRWLVLYPLYALAEVAIIATDLAELLGSAIALVLLIPKLPLYAGVLITAADVFVILLLSDPGRSKRPVKVFELTIVALVMIVFVSFIILIIKVKPQWGLAFAGFLPSKTLFRSNALYTGIGILGATVMPHALFLGSSLATQDRISKDDPGLPTSQPTQGRRSVRAYMRSLLATEKISNLQIEQPTERRIAFVDAHLNHGVIDIVMSLLGFAMTINSAILILAGTVFFYAVAPAQRGTVMPASLFDAYDVIEDHIGKAAAILFAVALLCAGQSAAITATLSGQIVSEGYIAWRMSPFLTRATTRMIALIPAAIVAAVVGKSGINSLLVASQVVLSLILPFVVFPLVYFTSNQKIMTLPREAAKEGDSVMSTTSFANGRVLKWLGYFIFLIIVIADIVAIGSLILNAGQGVN